MTIETNGWMDGRDTETMGRRDEWNDAETMMRRRDRSNEGFASACATLERAMRRLANEMTIHKTGRPRRGGPRERETGTMTERRSSPSLSSSLSSLSSLSSISSISSNVRETRVVDESESVDSGTEAAESTRGRRDEEKDERDGVRRLEMKCARLESTVVTLRRALEDRTRRRSNDASRDDDDDEDERDEAARDVLAHEIMVLRRCVKRASMERDRLLEMSNDLRAALHRSRAETRESRLKTPTTTTTTSIPIVEAKPSVRASIALASIASSTSERETFSQRSKLKSAMRCAKERRAAAATVPAVRNWNRVRTSEANQ